MILPFSLLTALLRLLIFSLLCIENLDIVDFVARDITGTSAPNIENHDFVFFVARGTTGSPPLSSILLKTSMESGCSSKRFPRQAKLSSILRFICFIIIDSLLNLKLLGFFLYKGVLHKFQVNIANYFSRYLSNAL